MLRRSLFISALLALLAACGGSSQKAASTSALPKYSGADRQQVLEAGAKQEGRLTVYTSTVPPTMSLLIEAFMAKYPFVKVEQYRADNGELVQRVSQEEAAGKHEMDLLETTTDGMIAFIENDFLQPFTSPELAAYPKDSIQPQNLWAPVRASYVGLGYNTKLITKEEAPKTFDDLLNPKWKAKMAIAGSSTGVRWVGNILYTKDEDFLKKLGGQQIKVQNVSGRAIADMVIAGEVPLSPTIFDSHVAESKTKGAPIEWLPIEPTVVNLGATALAVHPSHPNAALLFMDFALSEAGQKIYTEHGYQSLRQGMSGPGGNFKKLYLDVAVPNYTESFDKWQQLLRTTFTTK